MTTRGKACRCVTCGRDFHSLGIMGHRAAHRRRGETCEIIYYNQGVAKTYPYAEKGPKK